jgi:3-oxoacyl-[acyl-carrier-protein] synthase-3
MGKRESLEDDCYFKMDGQKVFRLIYGIMPGFVERFLAETKQSESDFDLIIPHQASGPALSIMMRRFERPGAERKVFVYLQDYGNLIAASIPMGIHFAIQQGKLNRGDRVLLIGTGAGLSLGAASFVY